MYDKKLLLRHPDLLVQALQQNPDLLLAATVAARARERGVQRVRTHRDLRRLLGRAQADVQVAKYFPQQFLPCEDESDLLRKVMMASGYGQQQHVLAALARPTLRDARARRRSQTRRKK